MELERPQRSNKCMILSPLSISFSTQHVPCPVGGLEWCFTENNRLWRNLERQIDVSVRKQTNKNLWVFAWRGQDRVSLSQLCKDPASCTVYCWPCHPDLLGAGDNYLNLLIKGTTWNCSLRAGTLWFTLGMRENGKGPLPWRLASLRCLSPMPSSVSMGPQLLTQQHLIYHTPEREGRCQHCCPWVHPSGDNNMPLTIHSRTHLFGLPGGF